MKFIWNSLLIIVFLFAGCARKQSNLKLAKVYYKMAILEISGSLPQHQKYKKALRHINAALLQYRKVEYLALKAVLLFKLGEIESSKKIFKSLLNLDLDYSLKSEIKNNYACLLAQIGEIKRALLIWSDLESDSDYLTPEVAFFNQGKYYLAKGNLKKSKEKLLSAVYIAPNYVDAQYYLAIVAKELGDLKSCKNQISTVLFLEPNHFGVKQLLNLVDNKIFDN